MKNSRFFGVCIVIVVAPHMATWISNISAAWFLVLMLYEMLRESDATR